LKNIESPEHPQNRLTKDYGLFHTHFTVWLMFIVEDPTVTMKFRTATKTILLYTIRNRKTMAIHSSSTAYLW